MINPDYQLAYEWDFKQNQEMLLIGIALPDNVDSGSINYELSKENRAIKIVLDQEPPILSGILLHDIGDVVREEGEQMVFFKLQKLEPVEWNVIIKSPIPEQNIIDPKSAFILYQLNIIKDSKKKLGILLKSAVMGYTPALKEAAQIFILEGDIEQGIKFYTAAANKYNDAESYYELAMINLKGGDRENGLLQMNQSANLGFAKANIYLGMLYSPFSSIDYENKDARKALTELAIGLKKISDASAYHEMSLIYLNGSSEVKQDKKLAKIFQEKAHEINPNYELLLIDKTELVHIAIGLGVGFLAFGAVFYLIVKRNKK